MSNYPESDSRETDRLLDEQIREAFGGEDV
jgi:hypothetical protein